MNIGTGTAWGPMSEVLAASQGHQSTRSASAKKERGACNYCLQESPFLSEMQCVAVCVIRAFSRLRFPRLVHATTLLCFHVDVGVR